MAAKKRNTQKLTEAASSLTDQQKIVRLLAMLAIKGETQPDKIKILVGSGFTGTEIADMLGMKVNAVHQAMHRLRSK